MAYYPYYRNRGYRGKRKTFETKNVNVLSSQQRSRLDHLKGKYKDGITKPELSNFGLNAGLTKDIEIYNTKVGTQNSESREKSKKRSETINLFWFAIIILSFLFLWNYLRLQTAYKVLALIAAYVLIAGFSKVFTVFDIKEKAYPVHGLTDNLQKYQATLNDYEEYSLLLKLETKEREEKQKREFWFSLSGFEFESEMAKLFSAKGFSARKTKSTGDGGIDINLTDERGRRTIVQCKAHKKPIGPHEARALYGLMQAEQVHAGMLVSLGGFTQGVRDFIKGKNITLFDVEDVVALQKSLVISSSPL